MLTPAGIGALPTGRAFHDGLREAGWVQGQNLAVEYRFATAPESVAVAVPELLALKPDVIVGEGNPIIRALRSATDSVPIVMAPGNDPVRAGLVTSLARPGGNVTGLASLSAELIEKRLDLLKQTLPRAARIACVWYPDLDGDAVDEAAVRSVADKLGMQTQFLQFQSGPELERAFEAAAGSGADALLLLSDLQSAGFTLLFAGLVARTRLPMMSGDSDIARSGSLLAYGPSLSDLFHRAATYVDKILKGAKPADLPIEQPTVFDFVINLKTAQALGLTIPQSVLLQATEVIQ